MVEKFRRQRPSGRCCLVLGALAIATSGCGMVSTGQNMNGVRLYQQGQYYGAMEQFQKAMASDPNDADAYYNMAATLHQMGARQQRQ